MILQTLLQPLFCIMTALSRLKFEVAFHGLPASGCFIAFRLQSG